MAWTATPAVTDDGVRMRNEGGYDAFVLADSFGFGCIELVKLAEVAREGGGEGRLNRTRAGHATLGDALIGRDPCCA